MASTETLIFEILAKDAQASAAFDRFRRQVDNTSKSVDKNSGALDKNTQALDRNTKSHRSWIGVLAGGAAAFAPITAGAAAAGAGIVAFTALAVPSVAKVTKALTGPGGLAASWDQLDNRQRNAALGIQAIEDRYQGLAKTLEPQVFQNFNQGLGLANSLLGPTGQLARTSSQGLSDFLAQFANDSGIQHFIGFLSTQARPALDLLGSDLTHASHALFSLLEAFGPTGISELRLLTGAFTALDDSVSFLSAHAPGLTSAGVAIGGIALALHKLGALKGALQLTGVASIAGQLKGFTEATAGATLAEKGLLAGSTALKAISPWGWVALGAGALIALNAVLSKTKDETDKFIATAEQADHATGFNTAGYKLAAQSLGAYTQNLIVHQQEQAKQVDGTRAAALGLNQYSADADRAAQETERLSQAASNQDKFLVVLQTKYNLTRGAAISLAQHAGVLASQVNKGGDALHNAVTKTEAYANANLKAQRPTSQFAQDLSDAANNALTLKDRTNALSDALDKFFNPAVSADQAVIALKNDQKALAQALAASGGQTGLLTQKQRDARGAFDTYIGDVANAAQAAFNASGKTADYRRVINEALPILERAAGHNKALRAEIAALIATENRLHTEHVAISVTGTGSWSVRGGNTGGAGHPQPPGGPGFAFGGMVTGGRPGVDSVPILAQQGELVVPRPLVSAGAVDHLRGVLPGFAAGGVVGSYSGRSIPGLDKWLNSENQATIRAIADSVAKATVAGLGSLSGIGGQVARYALSYNGGTAFPYVLGGATPQGWDCSGFTAWVYEKFGLMPGHQGQRFGTSESQWAWSRHISRPVPGALAFFNDGVFANPGHVGIVITPSTYMSAHDPAEGTSLAPLSGAVGFGVPPGHPAGLSAAATSQGALAGAPIRPGRRHNAGQFSLGDLEAAWAHKLRLGSFDQGGFLPTGLSMAYNGTGRPEPVIPAGHLGGGRNYHITVNVPPTANMKQVGRDIVEAIKHYEQGSGPGWRK